MTSTPDPDDTIALSALQHYLFCPRQCALIHIEQIWSENVYTAEGRVLHEQADKPHAESRRGVRARILDSACNIPCSRLKSMPRNGRF